MTWHGNNLLTLYFSGSTMNPPLNEGIKMDHNMTWVDGAAIAMAAGILANEESGRIGKYDISRWAYDIAEAMLEEKMKREAE